MSIRLLECPVLSCPWIDICFLLVCAVLVPILEQISALTFASFSLSLLSFSQMLEKHLLLHLGQTSVYLPEVNTSKI
jgi:hypothetical protein